MKIMKITEQDKRGIILEAKAGVNANSINRRYPKYTRQQIAAIIAWVTMGKYGDKYVVKPAGKPPINPATSKKNHQEKPVFSEKSVGAGGEVIKDRDLSGMVLKQVQVIKTYQPATKTVW